MKLLKPSPHRERNDFDLSHRHLMTANFGELLPITCIETVPGDTIKMRVSDLLRAMPMVTSPFLRAKQHIDVWFVPYTHLWSQFNEFITQRDEHMSSAINRSARFCPWDKLIYLWNSNPSISTDIIGRPFTKGRTKILNYLGYGSARLGSDDTSPSVNLFRLAAYNYIWYSEYRQPYYDSGFHGLENMNEIPQLFNFDALDCSSLGSSQYSEYFGQQSLDAMCQMRYRCWKKDLFTGLLPSTQFGDVSTVDMSFPVNYTNDNAVRPASVVGYLSQSGTAGVNKYGIGPDGPLGRDSGSVVSSATTVFSNNYVLGVDSHFDVLALRKSEAIQIWRENALRAGNRVVDNLRAHYGVDSNFEHSRRPVFLGSVDSPLNISDVNATAQTGEGANQYLGDVAGKGISSMDNHLISFNAKDFGVIMCMFSLLPEAEYNANGIDRMNQLLESEDFFIPEYQNLGLEAVSSQTFVHVPTDVAKIIGYAPRYYGYKQKLDFCFGQMRTSNDFAIWSSPKYDVTQVMTSPDGSLPLSVLYVNPKIFDVNFGVSVDNSEQFICDFYFDVDAVRPMSVIGMPFS